jgi:hypothetical protein
MRPSTMNGVMSVTVFVFALRTGCWVAARPTAPPEGDPVNGDRASKRYKSLIPCGGAASSAEGRAAAEGPAARSERHGEDTNGEPRGR